MPPSPSLRRSPGRESRNDSHKRGRSLESGLSFKEKDDDLALFNEMQTKERENFLLQPSDDFEDILSSKVKSFPDFKLGINIPSRGESSDLLNAESDKNDYDWLLTPPDTPLFPSLDDEPTPVNLVHSGRPRSRPISISRSSTMERSQRSSRGSPSPQRLSPSPRSGSGTFEGRPSSAPHSSPIPLRPSTPSRRPSPPPVKPSTPPPRSLTPTSRRTSGGPLGGPVSTSGGVRGTSPVRTSRGNSASPKIRAWQSNIPGFSLEAPPNLRTSLADRPASYVRGSSPASRASRDSPSRFGRQSMSPTATRSISSSHSQERDRLSSHSRGSVASSGDDDADSLQSIPVSVVRKGGFPSSKPSTFSKKPTKTFSPSSAPKRSFDSAMRQLDRRSPQNMFRPLLSSVPSSTFYAGKATSVNRTLTSRNSSVTTSSNASSDQATSGAHDTECSDHYQDDMTSEFTRIPFSDPQDEVFAFDKMDATNEDTGLEVEAHHALSEVPGDSEESGFHVHALTGATSEGVDLQGDFQQVDGHEILLLCSRCGCHYQADELTETEDNICPECKQIVESLINISEESNRMDNINPSQEENKEIATDIIDERNISKTAGNDENTLEVQNCLENSLSVLGEGNETVTKQQKTEEVGTVYNNNTSHSPNNLREIHKCSDKSEPNIDVGEGAGISVLLLKRSSSIKGPLIHSRTINSSAVSYEDLSYARDLTSSMRSSTGHGSISTSSSIDLTSARQLSGRRSDTGSKLQRTGSSSSGNQGFGPSTSSREENEGSLRHIAAMETPGSPSDQVMSLENGELPEEDNASVMARHKESTELDNSLASTGRDEGFVLNESHDDSQRSVGGVENGEDSALGESSVVESTVIENRVVQMEVAEDPPQCSLSTMSEIEIDDSHPSSPSSQVDVVLREELEDPSVVMHHHDKDDAKGSSLESGASDHADVIVEESTVTLEEDHGGRRTRSLTLEEATDTILFCSSIIHDLAYKAASIAIEREKENLEPLEGSRPTVTIPEKHSSNRKDPRGISTGKTVKSQKARKRSSETEAKPPHVTENNEKPDDKPVDRNVGLPNNGDSMKPPKLESKCNCTIM